MKMLVVVIVATAAWLVPCAASACECCDHHQHGHAAAHASAAATAQLAPGEARVRIPVTGMHCGHCVSRVEAALAKLDGVKRADASLKDAQAVVVFEKSKLTSAKLVETIDALGFKSGTPE
ncbi:MAG TPA: heavy-metal-associated domain-containing protein [Anaeromyxobacteraceae bacterium]|nr:heavy-metal-associated domain-containing protein [Anaeromyxobacteraceae bacterium]